MFLQSVVSASIARVQLATGTTLGSSLGITLGSTPQNGNFLVMGCGLTGITTPEITGVSQTGATWSLAVSTVISGGGGNDNEIWYAANVSGAATSITVSFSGSIVGACHVVEYSGIQAISPLDKTASKVDSDTGGSQPQSGTTATTAATNELWFASINNNTKTTGAAPTNGFVYLGQATGATDFQSSLENIVSSVGTASTLTGWGGSAPFTYIYAGNVATFIASNDSSSITSAPILCPAINMLNWGCRL